MLAALVATVAVAQQQLQYQGDVYQQEILVEEMVGLSPQLLKFEQARMPLESTAVQVASKQNDSVITKTAAGVLQEKRAFTYDQWGNQTIRETYTWDGVTSKWIPATKGVDIYNIDGNYVLIEGYNKLSGANDLVCTQRYIYDWGEDSNGNWTLSYIYYNYDSSLGQLVYNSKQEAVFHGHTNVYKTLITSNWNTSSSSWVESYKLYQIRNEDGFDQTMASFNFDAQNNTWIAKKTGYTMNSQGVIIQKGTYSGWNETTQVWSNLTVENVVSVAPVITINYNWSNNAWVPYEKIEIVDGFVITYAYSNGQFIMMTKESQVLDASGNEISYLKYESDVDTRTTWVQRIARYYRYDTSGNMLFERFSLYSEVGLMTYTRQRSRSNVSSPWNPTVNWERYYFYNQQNLQTSNYLTRFINDVFVNAYKYDYIYDNEQDVLKINRSDWNGSVWVPTSYEDYYYSTLNNVVAVESMPIKQDGKGSFELKFNIPTDAKILTGTVGISLPQGFTFDPSASHLSDELSTTCNLQFSQNQDGTLQLTIQAINPSYSYPRAPLATKVQKIATIGYYANNSKPIGTYTAHLYNSDFTFSNNPPLTQALMMVNLNITETISGNAPVPQEVFTFSPNPAGEKLIVMGIKDKLLQIYDLDGKIVCEKTIQSDEEQISLSGYAKGFYLLKLKENGKLTATEKLIIQ